MIYVKESHTPGPPKSGEKMVASTPYSIRMSVNDHQILKQNASARGLSMAAYLRELIRKDNV